MILIVLKQQQQQQQQQQMMMLMKMQEQAKNRMPLPSGGQHPSRAMVNPGEAQRMPSSQQGNMPVMINLQGHGGVPPSPDKARGMPLMMAGAARRMSHPETGPGTLGTGSEEAPGGGHDMGMQSGNGSQQMVVNQGPNAHMKQGPGPSTQHPGASPQQQMPAQPQQGGPMTGHHFPNVPTTSQSSRPKTPNRASPRPYHHPLTPTNRPPSTEPSEINLSPERLNASIAGLFPPKINIPLPPRQPNLSRGFDQQGGLNPTTLKAIGQAPPSLSMPGNNGGGGGNSNNGQQSFPTGSGVANSAQKQDKQSGGALGKRVSPSNSRRSSPASSRKAATPSPGRQKGAKMALASSSHQQPLVNPQTGQTIMHSPALVPPSPISHMHGTGPEAQQNQSPFQVPQSNVTEMSREGQGMPGSELRPMPQSVRELSTPRMASPRVPTSQEAKSGLEPTSVVAERQSVSEASPALRAAPTSLNQLLDNSVNPSVQQRAAQGDSASREFPKPTGDREIPSGPFQSSDSRLSPLAIAAAAMKESEAKPKPSSTPAQKSPNPNTNPNLSAIPSLSLNPSAGTILHSSFSPGINPGTPNPNLNPAATSSPTLNQTTSLRMSTAASPNTATVGHRNPSPNPAASPKPVPGPKAAPSVSAVLQIPVSSAAISTNQITVLVTSNPVSSTSVQVQPTVVSAMMSMPNKNIRPQQAPGPRPQFITTPVFINTGTPIFQVPTSSPNTGSQPVSVVGPIQVSGANFQFTTGPTQAKASAVMTSASTQAAVVSVTGIQTARTLVEQVQMATRQASPVPPPQQQQSGTPKIEAPSEVPVGQKYSPPVGQPSPRPSPSPTASISSPFHQPLVSPPPCSSPSGSAGSWKSPMSPALTAQAHCKQVHTSVTTTASSLPGSQLVAKDRPTSSLTGTSQSGLNVGVVPPHASPPLHVTQNEAHALTPPATALKVATPLHVSSPAVSPVLAQSTAPAQTSAPAPTSYPLVPVRVNTPTPVLVPSQTTSPVTPGPTNSSGESAVSSSSVTLAPTGSQPVPTSMEPPNQPAQPDAPASADNTQATPASVEGKPQEEAVAIEKTAEDGATISEQGWAKKRKAPINLIPRTAVEKPKGPSRRSSRADKEVEEETVADSMQRKRPARPGASAATKETGASPNQAKRRKSK